MEKVKFESENWKGGSMKEIIEDLMLSRDTLSDRPREYIIEGKIEEKDIKALVDLPVEILITKSDDGRLILGTGFETSPTHEWNNEARERIKNSTLVFHTHPKILPEIVGDVPSLSDLMVQLRRKRNGLDFSIIGHPKGLLVFTYIFNSDTMSNATFEYEMLQDKLRDTPKEEIDWKEVGERQREIVESSGCIVSRADWGDSEGISRIISLFE